MDHRARKLTLLAILSACFTTLVTTALAAQSAGAKPAPEVEPAPPNTVR